MNDTLKEIEDKKGKKLKIKRNEAIDQNVLEKGSY